MPVPYEQFEQLLMAEFDSVVRLARALATPGAEADDLVQETYLRAIQAREGFELRAMGVRPWLLRILNNVFLTRVAREGRAPKAIDSDQLNAMQDESSSPIEPASATDIDWSKFDGRLARAVGRLAPPLRSTILLWALEDLTYREIADVTGVPIGTVMSRLHRARRTLTEVLEPLARERGLPVRDETEPT
jgi:RNA polymerase sigma-70 factor, ECF subfamily